VVVALGGGGVGRFLAVEVRRDFVAGFFVRLAFGVVVVEVVAPDVTRDECFVRCLTLFLPAASAVAPSVKAAISVTTMSVNRVRIIRTLRRHDTPIATGSYKEIGLTPLGSERQDWRTEGEWLPVRCSSISAHLARRRATSRAP
jgi:hypothetical protein